MKYTDKEISKSMEDFKIVALQAFPKIKTSVIANEYLKNLKNTLDPYQAKLLTMNYFNNSVLPALRKTSEYNKVRNSKYLVIPENQTGTDAADTIFRFQFFFYELAPVHAAVMYSLTGDNASLERRKKAIYKGIESIDKMKDLQLTGIQMSIREKLGLYFSRIKSTISTVGKGMLTNLLPWIVGGVAIYFLINRKQK